MKQGWCVGLGGLVWLVVTVPVLADAEEERRAEEALPPEVRIVSPRAGLTGNEVDPLHDVEGGPISEGEQLRRWTPITEAELNAVDPAFRRWAELISTGQADKRIMRLYWFYRHRLEPLDRPMPTDWRERGFERLRDDARTHRAVRAFEDRRRAASAPSPAPGGAGSAGAGSLDTGTASANGHSATATGGGVSAAGVWVPVGPYNIAGRTTGLAGDADNLYAAVADGGVWRTRTRGQTWERLSDFEETLSGGSIVLDPLRPNIIYFGTGEGNNAIDNYPGIGVLKSVDGGLTWTKSNEFSSIVRRLAIHESDTDRLLAAGAQGCYESTDAGATFSLISDPGLPTGISASDVLFRPDNPDWIYCAMWGNPNGGVYRSTDGGATWAAASAGMPPLGSMGRIALAVSQSNPDILLAGIDHGGGSLYKTTDGGDNWVEVGAGLSYCGGQCWYDNAVGIDPVDPDTMYAGGISAYKSTNGGATWSLMSSGVHVDHHFVFTPSAGEVLLANDGGVYYSSNHGGNWTEWSLGMDTTQYYGVCRHPSNDYWAFGGTQDNGSHRRRQGDGWTQVLGADGGMCMSGPDGSNIVIGEYQNHNMRRSTDDAASWTNANGGIGGGDPRSWVGLLIADPSDRNKMWTSTNRIYRSLDARATDWVSVSGTLYFGVQVTALEVAPTDSATVYAGFSAGGLFKTNNGLDATVNWTSIRQANLPQTRTIRRIRAHPDILDTVYLVYSGSGAGKLWKSTDGGATWVDHTGDLPAVPVNDLLIDADSPGTLIAATDLGVYRSDDDGATWYGFSIGLPTAAAIELTYHRATGHLRVGTHGRSMWDWQPAQATPTAVPDGTTIPGTPMRAARLAGGLMRVYWDARSCTAQDYNLFYGDLDDVATRTYSGSECGLGTAGQADVPLPVTASGNAFFVLAATDGAGTEGPHAYDDAGQPLGSNGIGFCGITNQDTLAACP